MPYDGLHDGIFQTPQSQKHTGVTRLTRIFHQVLERFSHFTIFKEKRFAYQNTGAVYRE